MNGTQAPAAGPATLDQAAAPAPAVEPFWQRMPRLFLFPLQRAPLLRNLGCSLAAVALGCALVGDFAANPLRAVGLLMLLYGAATLYIARYAFLVIERSSSGYLDSGGYPPGAGEGGWSRPVKMFLVLFLMPLLIGIIGAFLPMVLGKLLLLAWAMLLPASVIVLTTTDSFGEAANPGRCFATARTIGWPYLLLCLYLVLIDVGFHEVLGVALPSGKSHGPVSTAGFASFAFVFLAVSNYFFVLTCALIGYVMYQYSGELGVQVVGPGDSGRRGATSAAAHARRQREALLGRMLAAGEVREALELLSNELRERPSDLSLHVRLHTLLLHEGSRPKIEAHAMQYLELLLAAGSSREALALWEQTRAMFPEFAPRDPLHRIALAREALAGHQPAQAAELVRGFDKRFPAHPAIAEAYVIGARVLLQGEQERQARHLLRHVVEKYPGTPAAVEAQRYLARFA